MSSISNFPQLQNQLEEKAIKYIFGLYQFDNLLMQNTLMDTLQTYFVTHIL